MTLQQLAEAIGATKGHLSNVENYVTSLTPAAAEAIARVLGIDASVLWQSAPGQEIDQEQILLSMFRTASPEAKKAILASARAIAEIGKS